MGRPQKQTVDYFPHDAQASQGDTLTILQGKWGNDGYAFWFRLLEKLCNSDGHFIDCSNPVKWGLLLAKTQLTNGTGDEIMNTLVEIDAIDRDLWESSHIVWCQNLVDNIADAYKNRRRAVPEKPVSTNKNPKTTTNKPHTKLNDTKLNKTKYGEFKNVLLTDIDYKKIIDKFGEVKTKNLIEKLSEGIERKNYKYKNFYLAILDWERRDAGTGTNKSSTDLPREYTRAPTDPELENL